MARKAHISKEEILQAKQLRDNTKTIVEFRKALSVILAVELGLDADQAADILGTSHRTVFRHRSDIRHQGDTPKRSWGGRSRCCMSIQEERAFLAPWEVKAAEGGVLSVPPIHAALVQRLGYNTPMSTTYRFCWHAMAGAWYNRTPSISRATLRGRMSSKKTARSGGCRQPEKCRPATDAPDVPG